MKSTRCDIQSMHVPIGVPSFLAETTTRLGPDARASRPPFLRSGSCLQRGDLEIKMITAAEYRAWAEESLEFARTAANESSREAYIKFAEIWLESALRASALPLYLSALLKSRYLQPIMSGCCPRLENGGAKALHPNDKAFRPIPLRCQAAHQQRRTSRIADLIASHRRV